MFKKSFIISILSTIIVFSYAATSKVSASTTYRNISHDDIIELTIPSSTVKLLNQMSDSKIDAAYKKVDKKAFGWSAYTITDEVSCKYVSSIIFAKSNSTDQVIEYKYTLKYSETQETEISKSGTICGKIQGKVTGITPSVEAALKKDESAKTKTYYEEQTKFSMEVAPGKKLTLRVSGDAILSNGVGKYFFLGIPFKTGTWEYIDKVNEFYEMYEEDI